MGLLYGPYLDAIKAGARVRQRWLIYAPTSSAHTAYNWTRIHDDADPDVKSVIDPGKRKVTGYNISMAVEGQLRVGDYSITVDNSSGIFYPGRDDSVWTVLPTYAYYADPQECFLEHELYVWYSGAWAYITPIAYKGRVVDVQYSDSGRHSGAAGGTCTITAENNVVSEILRYEWLESDGHDVDTGRNIYQG